VDVAGDSSQKERQEDGREEWSLRWRSWELRLEKVTVLRGAGWRAGQGPNSTFCGQTDRPNSSRQGGGLDCVAEDEEDKEVEGTETDVVVDGKVEELVSSFVGFVDKEAVLLMLMLLLLLLPLLLLLLLIA
jgi:hypothetical protein